LNANTGKYTANQSALLGFSEKDGHVTRNPKPQYVPVQNPWLYGQRFSDTLIPGTKTANMKMFLVLIYLHLHSKFVVQQPHQIHHLVNWILVI
jgi:hypothetical protein